MELEALQAYQQVDGVADAAENLVIADVNLAADLLADATNADVDLADAIDVEVDALPVMVTMHLHKALTIAKSL
ncbi:MAG: hypothetical protein KR126chlam1_00450 [Chlamydiae bacterium]|nr:hypothetical protein [Chlamydiota bacterium]